MVCKSYLGVRCIDVSCPVIFAEQFPEYGYEGMHGCEESSFGYYLAEAAIDEINVMPTVDIKPTKHGHWVEYPKPHYFKCSKCKYIVPYRKAVSVNGEREYDYCPNCGAIMDLEE